MNTWFSVHKDEQFLEDHDVLDKYLFYRTMKEEPQERIRLLA